MDVEVGEAGDEITVAAVDDCGIWRRLQAVGRSYFDDAVAAHQHGLAGKQPLRVHRQNRDIDKRRGIRLKGCAGG